MIKKKRVVALANAFMKTLIEREFGGQLPPFKPVAYYDKQLDRLVVITKDCSVTEERVRSTNVVLMTGNYRREKNKIVGFAVEEAKGFCASVNASVNGEVDLTHTVKALDTMFPQQMRHHTPKLKRLIKKLPSPVTNVG